MNVRDALMSRIKTVRSVRAFLMSPMSVALLSGTLLFSMSILVSLGDVVQNIMAHGEWSVRFSYTFSSLLHSRVMVQVLAFLTMLSFGLIFLRSLRLLRTPLSAMGNFLASLSSLRFFRS